MELEPTKALNRAKLYLLDDENEWLDQGTGFTLIEQNSVKHFIKPFFLIKFAFNFTLIQKKKNFLMKFIAEETQKEIHSFEINENIFFERKEGFFF